MQLADHVEKIAVIRIRSKVSVRFRPLWVLVRLPSRGVFAPKARRADELGDEARVPAFALLAPLVRKAETRIQHSFFFVAAWNVVVAEEFQTILVPIERIFNDFPPTAPAHQGGEVRLEADLSAERVA